MSCFIIVRITKPSQFYTMDNRMTCNFINDLQLEADLTLKIFSAVDETKKAIQYNNNTRSLERLAWHITQTFTEMPHRAGFIDSDALAEEPLPATFAEIIAAYKKYSGNLKTAIVQSLTDAALNDEVDIYGERWTKAKVINSLIAHQTHHRGQMTMLMRVLDIKVPGIYGPSKEEWGIFNMQAME